MIEFFVRRASVPTTSIMHHAFSRLAETTRPLATSAVHLRLRRWRAAPPRRAKVFEAGARSGSSGGWRHRCPAGGFFPPRRSSAERVRVKARLREATGQREVGLWRGALAEGPCSRPVRSDL